MTVRVRPLVIAAPPPGSSIGVTLDTGQTTDSPFAGSVLEFTDTFNRASGPLGRNWICGTYPFTPNVTPLASMQMSVGAGSDASQACLMTFIGINNPNTIWYCQAIPILVYNRLYGVNQFSQLTFISGAVNSLCGIAVGCKADGQNNNTYYCLVNSTNGNSLTLRRVNGSVITTLATIQAAQLVAGDIIRLSVDFSNPAQVELTSSLNGVPTVTVDNNVNRFYTGVPGMVGVSMNQTGSQQYRNFLCGAGA